MKITLLDEPENGLGSSRRMQRLLINVLFFVVLLCLADEVRVQLEGHISALQIAGYRAKFGDHIPGQQLAGFNISAWLSESFNAVLLVTCVYALVYAVVGAVVAWYSARPITGIGFAGLLGLATPLASLFYGAPRPFAFSSHGPWVYDFLGWSNWYAPPVAAIFGALIWNAVAARKAVRHILQ